MTLASVDRSWKVQKKNSNKRKNVRVHPGLKIALQIIAKIILFLMVLGQLTNC